MSICRVCNENYEGCEVYTGKDHITLLPCTDNEDKNDINFYYNKCPICNSYVIQTVPHNIADFYGQGYYSYEWSEDKAIPPHKIDRALYCIDKFKLKEDTSILEWGGGHLDGILSYYVNGIGIKGQEHKLRCYEPFAEDYICKNEKLYSANIKRQKDIPTDMEFDFIFSIHSIEHVPNIYTTLLDMKKILNKDKGIIYFENPISDSFINSYFGLEAVGSDVPRHITVPTRKGLKMVIEKAGFEIIDNEIKQNETLFNIYFSEQQAMGKTYKEAEESIKKLSAEEIMNYAEVCKFLNKYNIASQVSYAIRLKK